nr:hypothetical protein [Pedobacter panaciterrae]
MKTKAQDVQIKPLITAWKRTDTSQTHKAEQTYNWFRKDKDFKLYQRNLRSLYAYLKNNPDDRLWVRTVMYDIFGKREFRKVRSWQYQNDLVDTSRLYNCIKIAYRLNDDQLKAELYTLYAEISYGTGNYLLYNLKAIELQQKVGTAHFIYAANLYYNVSLGLYEGEDYQQSIDYGLKFLSFEYEERKNLDPRLYIMQLDLIGASYLRLAKNELAKQYYQHIIDTLTKRPDHAPEYQQLWMSIAKGNIGRVLMLDKQYTNAMPLVTEHLQTGIRLNFYNNAAMAQNTLAEIGFEQQLYPEAIAGFKKAYRYAIKSNTIKEKIRACKGLSNAYRITKQTDSAFEYYNRYHQYQDNLTANINEGKLSAVNARMAFDNAQDNLENANKTIKAQRLTRNLIISSIALLTIIALLAYNRKMLKQRHKEEMLLRKQKDAELEAHHAKIQIVNFTENIIEKDQLLKDLQQQINNNSTLINENLANYTLITDEEWEKFRFEFQKAYPHFLPVLRQKIEHITPSEERLSALLYLKLTTSQIASTLGISDESVSRSKRRLKLRLDLSQNQKLEDYLLSLA